jgi:hypothetical protein
MFMQSAAGGDEVELIGPLLGEGQGTELRTDGLSLSIPVIFPSSDRILEALPKAKNLSRPIAVRADLISFRVSEEKFYPLIGPAHMTESRFKCTVKRAAPGESGDVVILNYRQLILKGPGK